jgi:hypothetical protein
MQHPHQAFSDLSIAVRPIAGAIGGPDCQWHYGVGGRFARQATAVIAGAIPVIEPALTGGLLYFGLRASLAIRPTPSTTCLTPRLATQGAMTKEKSKPLRLSWLPKPWAALLKTTAKFHSATREFASIPR